jgi:hypothetical protein
MVFKPAQRCAMPVLHMADGWSPTTATLLLLLAATLPIQPYWTAGR